MEYRCRLGVNCITSPEVLMRTAVVRDVGGQRDLAHTHDMEMWLRLARATDVGWLEGPHQAWHREHDASLSALQVDVLTDLEERAEAFEVLFRDGLGRPEQSERLHRMARTALGREAVRRVCQAYVRGWGGSTTTDAYLAFARRMVGDLGGLPETRFMQASMKAGPRRARYVPRLLIRAASVRFESRMRRRMWAVTGL